MNTREIESVLMNHPVGKLFSIGVFASDQLPTSVRDYPFIAIVNVDPISKPGSHWLGLLVMDQDSPAEFFDSYGQPPIEPIADFLHQHSKKIVWTRSIVQAMNSSLCGAHCLFFLIHRSMGYSTKTIMKYLYCKDLKLNDCRALLFISPYMDVLPKTLCINQTCTMKSE